MSRWWHHCEQKKGWRLHDLVHNIYIQAKLASLKVIRASEPMAPLCSYPFLATCSSVAQELPGFESTGEKLSMKVCLSIWIINYTAAKVPAIWKAFLKIGCCSWDGRCCPSCQHCDNSAFDLSTWQPAPFPRWHNSESEAMWLRRGRLVHITSNLQRLIRSTI